MATPDRATTTTDAAGASVERIKEENLPIIAAGVAFWALISIIPAAITLTTIYGLFASPQDVQANVRDLFGGISPEAQTTITNQFRTVAEGSSGALGIGLVLSIGVLLWTASSGMQNLLKATSISLTGDESRGFAKLRGLAILWALGAILLAALTIAVVAIVPPLLDDYVSSGWDRWLLQLAQWAVLAAVVAAALTALYRFGPDRDTIATRWAAWGAIGTTVAWILATVLFGIYVRNFGSYSNVYGALGGVIIAMLWLYLSSLLVLVGAVAVSQAQSRFEPEAAPEAAARSADGRAAYRPRGGRRPGEREVARTGRSNPR
jgi:membrane protein